MSTFSFAGKSVGIKFRLIINVAAILLLITNQIGSKYSFPAGRYFYLAIDGNDINPGTEEKPWGSLQFSVNQLSAGDTLYIKAGTYHPETDSEFINIEKSGTDSAPISIQGYKNDRPIIIPRQGEDRGPGLWIGLVQINGSNIYISQIEISHSTGHGLAVDNDYNRTRNVTINNVWIHNTVNSGIFVHNSDNLILKNSRIWMTNRINDSDGPWYEPEMWMGSIHAKELNNITIHANEIFDSYGEGINIQGGVTGAIIEDNTLYDSYAPLIYPINSVNIIIRRNLVYQTNDPEFMHDGNPGAGIVLSDEDVQGLLDNVQVVNNFVAGTSNNFGYWYGYIPGSGLKDCLIAHNTFVNSRTNRSGWSGAIILQSGQHKNTHFENNIIFQTDQSAPIIDLDDVTGITFLNNLWYPDNHVPIIVRSSQDIYQDPMLQLYGNIYPGRLTSAYFILQDTSPAINHAIISSITEDYFKDRRGMKPDIGADEYILKSQHTFLPFTLGIYARPVNDFFNKISEYPYRTPI